MSRRSTRVTAALLAVTAGAGALAASPLLAQGDHGRDGPAQTRPAQQPGSAGVGTTRGPRGEDNPSPRAARGQAGTPPGVRRGRSFRVSCDFVTSGMFDPITSPGQSPAGPAHQFFGAKSVNASSTPASLVAANVSRGSTSCLQSRDGSAYWVPALIADAAGTNAGTAVTPDETRVWYSAPRGQRVRAFPVGFTLTAGDTTATTPQDSTGWRCESDRPRTRLAATPPANCDPDDDIVGLVRFPNCWDGTNVSSTDRSHMAYRTLSTCPATHPVALPELNMEVFWPGDGRRHSYALSSGNTAGLNAGFMNGWDQRALRKNVRRWLNRRA